MSESNIDKLIGATWKMLDKNFPSSSNVVNNNESVFNDVNRAGIVIENATEESSVAFRQDDTQGDLYSQIDAQFMDAFNSYMATDKKNNGANGFSSIMESTSNEAYDRSGNHQDEDWKDVEAKADKNILGEITGYTYTTSDGTTIKLDGVTDIEDVEIYQNNVTGEIVVIGAKNAVIKGGKENVSLSVFDSEIKKINMGDGDDKLYVENSTVDEINGGRGDDKIEVSSSIIAYLNAGYYGNSQVTVKNNSIIEKDLRGGIGHDKFLIEDSTVNTSVLTGEGDDYLLVANSKVEDIKTVTGLDAIKIDNSQVGQIDSGEDSDILLVNSSNEIGTVLGGSGSDIIYLHDSTVKSVDGQKDADSIYLDNSKGEIVADSSDKVYKTNNDTKISPYEEMDEHSLDESVEITNEKTRKYTDRELTPQEQQQALTIDFFQGNLDNMKAQFELQESKDGVVCDSYNWIKELTELGVAKSDIEKAIAEQEQMVNELVNALNKKGEETFEEVFKRWTGVEYNEANIQEYQENVQLYSLAQNGMSRTETFKEQIQNAPTMDIALQSFVDYYNGDEKRARKEFNKMLQDGILSNPNAFPNCKSIEINEKNQLVREFLTGYDENNEPIYEPLVEEISDVTNPLNTLPKFFDFERYTTEFISGFESNLGISLDELQDRVNVTQLNAYGYGNSFQRLIDRYKVEQEGFADALASTAQLTGIGLMVAGGVVTFVWPPAGLMIMQAGKFTATVGTFSDQALEYLDNITSEQGASREQKYEYALETLQEIALLYSGAKINSVAGSAKDVALTLTQSKTLAFFAEIGTDTTLSLLTDMMITGEIDLTSEGISQLLGIVAGIAGAKVNAYTKESFDMADVYYKNGDPFGAIDALTARGIPKRKIEAYYKPQEIEAIRVEYEKTHSLNKALEMMSKSIFLSESDIGNLTAELKLDVLKQNGIDVSRYQGYDFSSDQGKLVAQDIDMYHKALSEGVNVNDLMVPTSKTLDLGLKNADIGDVFEIEGSKDLYVKTPDGQAKKLNISKETYCRLFPAIDRYSSGQQFSGDCYLVSALNSMMANPNSREKLLSCFSENPDGSITVKMPYSDTEVSLPKGKTINDIGVESGKHMTGSLGMQLLEYMYKVELKNNEIKNLQGSIDFLQNQLFGYYDNYTTVYGKNISYDEYVRQSEATYNALKNDVGGVMGKSCTDEQMDALLDITKADSVGCWDYFGNITPLGIDKISQATGIPSGETGKINKIVDLLLADKANNGNMSEFHSTKRMKDGYINEYQEKIDEINNNPNYFEEAGGHGGSSNKVFTSFGFTSQIYTDNDMAKKIDELIQNIDSQDNYVITAGINKGHTGLGPGLVDDHAYSFQIRMSEFTGEPEIVVTNPWALEASGVNKDIILTVEYFLMYFDCITIAELN